MNIQDLGSLGEFVAAIATIITLVYLAIQIRQNTRTLRMNAEIAMSHDFAEWIQSAIDNPELADIWDVAASDPDALSESDARRYVWYVGKIFLTYEGQFNLFMEGHITESAWQTKTNFLLGILANPIVAKWWDARIAPFSPEYFAYIDSRRANADTSWEIRRVVDEK